MELKNKSLILLLGIVFVVGQLFGGLREETNNSSLNKSTILSTGKFDGNRIDDDLENNGMIVSHRISGHSGFGWPAGNSTYAIYASGIWIAGIVDSTIRTAVAEYGPEFTSGPWGADGTGVDDRLYKVNKSDLDDPTANPDFAAWPVANGAPWVDVDGDGVYTPMPGGTDHPEFIGDQVIYYVMNDGVATDHSIFSTEPIGLEVRMTIWGYDRTDAFGDMMFAKAQIYNVGGNDVTDAYLGLWSDPDLGNAGDDFVGCDLDLSLGFCYNDGADNAYGYKAPAVGYDFFQAAFPTDDPTDTQFCFGEVKSGYKSLPMSSFVKYINSDPVYTDPNDAQEAYYYMSGYLRDGSPFINSATGEATKFVHPDDPNLNIDGTDNIWVDGDDNPADDRRFLMNVGPFDFAAGDSAEVVFGIIMAQGNSALGSVSLLKFNDKFAQSAYDANFNLPPAPSAPDVTVSRTSGEIILEWEDNAEDYAEYIAGNDSWYSFEGYNVYQHETAIGVGIKSLVATYDLKNGVTKIWDEQFSSEYGEVVSVPVMSGTDSGIKRYISIKTDAVKGGLPLVDDRNYYFSVTAYGFNGFSVPRVLESSSPIIEVRPQTDVAIDLNATTASSNTVSHTGTADAFVTSTVVNPYDLTGDDYEVYFDQQHYYRNLDGLWIKTAYADSVGKLAKAADLTGTVVTGAALASATVGTIDLVYSMSYASPDGAWIDGLEIDLPDDVSVNGWEVIQGAYSSYGTSQGQNTVNTAGTMAAGKVITWGDSARSTFGAIEGDVFVLINVAPITFPFTSSYKVFDDGYGTILDVAGTITITELGYEYKTIKHWNMKNTTNSTVLLEDMTTLNGFEHEYVDAAGAYHAGAGSVGTLTIPVTEGMQVNIAGSYDAPVTQAGYDYPSGYDWTSYGDHGWAATSKAIDSWGVGATSIDILQMDYELRWTGVYDDPDTTINGTDTFIVHPIKDGTGSIATWVGARGYAAADHPMNATGTAYFQLRIPFEVWNKDTGKQVSIIIYDRIANPTNSDFYAFNPVDRMYCWIWNEDYDETVTYDDAVNGANLTWNLISWASPWETGDVMTVSYANPLQLGVDSFSFTTAAPATHAADMKNVKVWPNPYFGYNPEERTPLSNMIHFINLPDEATISIFNLAGQLVRTLDHSGSQECIWDAQNSFNVLVASGMYIAVVDSDAGQKVLKLAVVMPQQRLDVY